MLLSRGCTIKTEQDKIMDNVTTQERSRIMSKVRSRNTKPELFLRKLLFSAGYRYRLYQSKLPGTPDLVLKKHNTVIFIQGCFWHGHENCKKSMIPDSHSEYWAKKIDSNRERDKNNLKQLLANGWRVLWVWECALSTKKERESILNKFEDWLQSDEQFGQIRREQDSCP